jgi:DNA-binding SARP family transcriptional activator
VETILLPKDVAIKAFDYALQVADNKFKETATNILSQLKAPPANPLFFHMLGGFRIYQGGREVSRESFRRAQAWKLICFLAHSFPRRVSHETIMEAFWPGIEEVSAKRNIYTNLSSLCMTLEPYKERNSRSQYIHHHDGMIWLEPSLIAGSDVAAFESSCQSGEAQLASGNDVEALALFRKARTIFKGDYLENEPYTDWAISRRSLIEGRLLLLHKRLSALLLKQGNLGEAISCLEEAFARDPFQEWICRALMKAYHQAGLRGKIQGCFDSLKESLHQELNVEPDPRTCDLYIHLSNAGQPDGYHNRGDAGLQRINSGS